MVEVKVKVLIIEEEKAEKSNLMNRYLDLLPKDSIKKRDEKTSAIKFIENNEVYEVHLKEFSSKMPKLEHLVNEANSIILVFNLDERSSFENLGNNIIQLKKAFKYENDLIFLGNSPSDEQTAEDEEIQELIKKAEIEKAIIHKIICYDESKIREVINDVIKQTIAGLKYKKSPEKKSTDQTSCIFI